MDQNIFGIVIQSRGIMDSQHNELRPQCSAEDRFGDGTYHGPCPVHSLESNETPRRGSQLLHGQLCLVGDQHGADYLLGALTKRNKTVDRDALILARLGTSAEG